MIIIYKIKIEDVIYNAFNRESESLKWAALFSLGNMAIGNMNKYVPILLLMIKNHKDRQYLLLNSLKEIITLHSMNINLEKKLKPFSNTLNTVVPLLLTYALFQDEGVRSMVAECLGKFAVIDNKIFEQIDQKYTTRSTMVAAVKCKLDI